MKISFIIPVYNCKTFLPDCVSSIRAAGIPDYEILLIDDGSTDGSGALCDELALKSPEIRVVHQPNAGASAARNRGIRESFGEQILFIDADDSLDPRALAEVLADPRCAKADLTIFGLTFDYYYHGQCYRQDPLFFPHDGILSKDTWGEQFLQLFLHNSLSPLWNKVFQRRILTQQELSLNESMFLYEDLEFVLRYMQHCDQIWNVPKAIYHYRQPEDEGNAGRRLKRINCIPTFLLSVESALQALPETVSKTDKEIVLQQLHLVLAREKIMVSDLRTIRRVCLDYRNWANGRRLPMPQDKFQVLLLEGKAMQLYLRSQQSQLRHWCAVRIKAMLKK